MGKQYKILTAEDKQFIKNQKLFFIASSSNAEVNISPKGYDSLRIINDTQALYLDYPGSGNRTARDISHDGNITLMFTAFEGDPQLVRLFCKGQIIRKDDERFASYLETFGVNGDYVRQLLLFDIYAVESSCGESVPIMHFQSERKGIKNWVKSMFKNGMLDDYIENHQIPIDLEKL